MAGRQRGSYNKRKISAEWLAEHGVSETDFEAATLQAEEKLKDDPLPPAVEIERQKNILREAEEASGYDRAPRRDEVIDLPPYLRNMPAGSDRSKHIVAAAQAALILGAPPAQVASQFGISLPRITAWKNALIAYGSIGRRDRLSDMLMAYIEQEMKSLMSISIVTSDEDWVMRQDAGELAQFVAVKSDRLLLLLQAFGRVDGTRAQYQQQLEVVTGNA